MEGSKRNFDSYSYQKEFIEKLTLNTKKRNIRRFPNLEITLIHLNQLVNYFRIPFTLLILNPDMITFILNAYFEQLYPDMVSTLMRSIIEVFNFEMFSTSPVIELNKALTGFGFNLNILPKRTELKDEEILYDRLTTIEENMNVLKALPDNDIEEEKKTVLYQLDEAVALFNKLKSDINTHKSSLEYFTIFLDRLNEFKSKPHKIVNINDIDIDTEMKDVSQSAPVNQISIVPKINVVSKKNINQFVSTIELKNRTSLYLNEKLSESESIDVEYKNYFFPFKPFQEEEIKEQICGMLNSKGGRIYIGINDEKIVKGILINYKQRDLVRNKIVNSTYEFFPSCRTKKIEVFFLPVKNFNTEAYRPSLFVIKIIVHQGETTRLYSLTSKKGYNAMIRLPGQVATLSAQEIEDEIIKRHSKPDKPVDDNLFQDPEPEKGVDNVQSSEKEKENLTYINVNNTMSHYNGKRKKGDTKKTFAVKVTGIPMNESEKTMENYFANAGAVSMKFFIDAKENKGYGYLNFTTIDNANKAIKKYNGVAHNGKKIELKLKESNNK